MAGATGKRVTVGTSPTLIEVQQGAMVTLYNSGGHDCDLGGSTVASGQGYLFKAGAVLGPMPFGAEDEALYGVCSTVDVSTVVSVLELVT